MSSSSSTTTTDTSSVSSPYVVIDLEQLGATPNTKPFKNARNAKPKAGKKNPRSPYEIWLYVFSGELVAGTTAYKIGKTGDYASYHSKNRYHPVVVYDGWFQVSHYGHALEVLVKAYLRSLGVKPYKNSEWYPGSSARVALTALKDALAANTGFSDRGDRVEMVNVEPFTVAFTCGNKALFDAYLSLFRVRWRGAMYFLCEENLLEPTRTMTTAKYRVSADPPAAPAAKVRLPALRSDDAEEAEDDESEEEEDEEQSETSSSDSDDDDDNE